MGEAGRPLAGWGRYPVVDCAVETPSDAAALEDVVARVPHRRLIARGLGRSYGDASLLASGVVVDQTRRDRLLAFDPESGVLRCEAGVSVATILDVLRPRGWCLPVVPGTKLVTVGGAIAADVHGKNHHVDGSFGRWVLGLRLLTGSGDAIWCSPDRDPEAFWATVGGMGLTGIILEAELQLVRRRAAYCDMHARRTENLDETLRHLEEGDSRFRYSVAWVDCLARGGKLGRAVLMHADDAEPEQLPDAVRRDPLRSHTRSRIPFPVTPPFSLVGRGSVRAFNALYYAVHRGGRRIVHDDAFFFPLDRIGSWNRLYGPHGFIQYQALFPRETAQAGLRDLLERLSAQGVASFLSVLKRTGPASGGLMSFPDVGHTLALDVPHPPGGFERLTASLDEVVVRHGGRVYLAKDATLSAGAFREMYPRLDEFLAAKHRLDPDERFASEQSMRLGITGSCAGSSA